MMNIVLGLFGLLLLLTIFILYKVIIYPYFRLSSIQKKYGPKIKVYFNFGVGFIREYKKSLRLYNDSLAFFRNMHQKSLQAIAYSYSTGVGFTFIDPELAKFVHQNHEVFQKINISMAISYLFGDSLIYARGKEWQRQRQFLGKSFHFEEIQNYLPSIKDVSAKVFGEIKEQLKQSDQKEIQIVKTCEKITSEVVFRVFFGTASQNLTIKKQDGSQISVAQELVSTINSSFQIFFNDKISLIKWIIFEKNTIKYFPTKNEQNLLNRMIEIKQTCMKAIEQRKQELLKDVKSAKYNFLDQYLKELILSNQSQITNEEIIDNFLALLFAGTDSTGNMTGAALYFLSIHPDIQNKAREEIIKLATSRTSSTNPVDLFNSLTIEDIQNLNLVNSVLKESLRLMPPAIEVFPRIAAQDIQVGDFQVKKGDFVNTHFIYNFSNPQIYPEPDKFDPTRWMKQKEQQNVFNFTPFSQGPRNCIGQHLAMIEGKCMIAYVLLNFEILPNKNQEIIKEMKIIYGFQKDNLVFFKNRS